MSRFWGLRSLCSTLHSSQHVDLAQPAVDIVDLLEHYLVFAGSYALF